MNLMDSPGKSHLGQTVHSKCVARQASGLWTFKMLLPSVKEFEHVFLICVHLSINYISTGLFIYYLFKNINSLEIKKQDKLNIKKNSDIFLLQWTLSCSSFGVQEPHFGDSGLKLGSVTPNLGYVLWDQGLLDFAHFCNPQILDCGRAQ